MGQNLPHNEHYTTVPAMRRAARRWAIEHVMTECPTMTLRALAWDVRRLRAACAPKAPSVSETHAGRATAATAAWLPGPARDRVLEALDAPAFELPAWKVRRWLVVNVGAPMRSGLTDSGFAGWWNARGRVPTVADLTALALLLGCYATAQADSVLADVQRRTFAAWPTAAACVDVERRAIRATISRAAK